MVFQCKLAISSLDLLVRCAFRDLQYIVIALPNEIETTTKQINIRKRKENLHDLNWECYSENSKICSTALTLRWKKGRRIGGRRKEGSPSFDSPLRGDVISALEFKGFGSRLQGLVRGIRVCMNLKGMKSKRIRVFFFCSREKYRLLLFAVAAMLSRSRRRKKDPDRVCIYLVAE